MADNNNSPNARQTSALTPVFYSTDRWLEENSKFFLPPVCNKMMHGDGQLKVFYVGGPNQRKDFHIEPGEELFYMVKGDMVLKVVEQGKHRDVIIKEGELFLLPGRIAHSPQRVANTIGLVIERERTKDEQDGLRYYVEKDGQMTTESLYEEWFHCDDLGTQLAPVMKRFFESEQARTGKPIPGTIPQTPPVILNSNITLEEPFNLKCWVNENRRQLNEHGSIAVFGKQYQFQVAIYGKGTSRDKVEEAETFLWQLEGRSTVTIDEKDYVLEENDTLLVREGQGFTANRPEGSVMLVCYQDPSRKAMTD